VLRLLAGAAAALLIPATHAAHAAGAATPTAIEGDWTVTARVVSADRGARPAEGARRTFAYRALGCAVPCRVRLAERLPGGGRPTVAFRRSEGEFRGAAATRLRCAGGSRVRARVNDRFVITRRVRRAGRRLAANLGGRATITGTCGGRAAELVVRWNAVRSDLPEPPTPSFASGPDPVSLTVDGGLVTFADTSADDVDGGQIVDREWDFGDPASGSANAARGVEVSHRYTTVGTFTVKLTVTDDVGLRATIRDVITVVP
jgi:PKD domain